MDFSQFSSYFNARIINDYIQNSIIDKTAIFCSNILNAKRQLLLINKRNKGLFVKGSIIKKCPKIIIGDSDERHYLQSNTTTYET